MKGAEEERHFRYYTEPISMKRKCMSHNNKNILFNLFLLKKIQDPNLNSSVAVTQTWTDNSNTSS